MNLSFTPLSQRFLTFLYAACRHLHSICLPSSGTFSSHILHHVSAFHTACPVPSLLLRLRACFHRTRLALSQPRSQAFLMYHTLRFKMPTLPVATFVACLSQSLIFMFCSYAAGTVINVSCNKSNASGVREVTLFPSCSSLHLPWCLKHPSASTPSSLPYSATSMSKSVCYMIHPVLSTPRVSGFVSILRMHSVPLKRRV